MKIIGSIISLSFIVIFLLVFSFPFICFSEVKTVQKTDFKWILYGKTMDGVNYYYNKDIVKVKPNIIRVREKRGYSKIEKNKIIELRKRDKRSINGWDKLDHSISLREIDCIKRTNILVGSAYFNDKEEVLSETYYSEVFIRDYMIKKSVIPDSISEILLKKVCLKK